MTDTPSIRCRVVSRSNVELSEETPRKGAITDALFEQNAELASMAASGARCGLWACGVGSFKSTKAGSSEISIILEGAGTIHDSDGRAHSFGAGDLVIVPDGWSGIWDVTAAVKKWYVSLAAAS